MTSPFRRSKRIAAKLDDSKTAEEGAKSPSKKTLTSSPKQQAKDSIIEISPEKYESRLGFRDLGYIFLVSAAFKLLLIPSYRSTDFEVHRNWLAITHSLDISKWYYEDTSEWTLDYPPFFAWFEWLLSQIAFYVDPKMLDVHALNYTSAETILFQRVSVIATEVILFLGALRIVNTDYFLTVSRQDRLNLVCFLFLTPGLLIVDHIHFQYNGFLYGIQLFTIAFIFEQKFIASGIFFAALLNFKHIYLYQAPAYFVFLLFGFCIVKTKSRFISYGHSFWNLIKLGSAVIFIFALSFGPFFRHLPQIVSRLFPFKRGLCHAYWAPNIWALYSFMDRALVFALKRAGVHINAAGSLTRGLVGDIQFSVMPDVKPVTTFILTLLSQMPILISLAYNPSPLKFVEALILCGFGSFMFGWHVHEKAILLVLIPLGILAVTSKEYARIFVIASVSGIFSLFPLLFEIQETTIKMTSLILFTFFTYSSLSNKFGALLNSVEIAYLLGFIPLFAYTEATVLFGASNLEFLPLMLTSLYTAIGLIYSWILFYKKVLFTTKVQSA